jgi:hypothetical protein
MRPLATRCAWIDGYRLCFDIPVGPGERGVANLSVDPTTRTHGVAYLLTPEDAMRLDLTEGVPQGLYFREDVAIGTAAETLAGFTYRSRMTTTGRKPSARYLDILLNGARTNGLPAEYVTVLESFALAFDERTGAVRR